MVDGAGTLRGMLTHEALIAALRTTGGATPVLDIMTRDVPTVPENGCLDAVFKVMQQRGGARFVGVVDPNQRLLGYITAENLAELVMIRSAREPPPGQAASTPRLIAILRPNHIQGQSPMPLPSLLHERLVAAPDRRAAVHRLGARAGHRPVQGRHRRLVPGPQCPAEGAARGMDRADQDRAGRLQPRAIPTRALRRSPSTRSCTPPTTGWSTTSPCA